jgi:hypothetical protein
MAVVPESRSVCMAVGLVAWDQTGGDPWPICVIEAVVRRESRWRTHGGACLNDTPDEWGCRAWAVEKATGEKLVGTDVTIAISKKEGWFAKNGSKWQSIPQQMLMYRAGSWWTRAYAPELSMGLHTADEMRDVYDAGIDEDGAYVVTAESLRTASSAPATSESGSVIDAGTGEIISQQNSAETQSAQQANPADAGAAQSNASGAPTFEDAMAAVKSGDIDAARDIARSLPEGQGKQIDAAIANRSAQNTAQSQQAAPASRRRTGSGPSVE